MRYLFLALVMDFELVGSTLLKLSQGFTRLLPSAFVVVGFGVAFYFSSRLCVPSLERLLRGLGRVPGQAATVLIGVVSLNLNRAH